MTLHNTTNNIYLYFKGNRKVSICQHFSNGRRVAQEVLDITDGFDGDPIPYGNTVEDLIRVLQRVVEESDHDCYDHAKFYEFTDEDEHYHGWECGKCGKVLQTG